MSLIPQPSRAGSRNASLPHQSAEALLIHISVALLVRDGLALLGHRHPSRRWYPDCWDLVGGHVDPGESPLQAVRRECLEELGVHIQDPTSIPLTTTDPALAVHAFLVTRWYGDPVITAPDELDDLRWFHPTELAALNLAHPTSLPDLLNALQAR